MLSRYRARYYDPTVGRFVSEDPLGFVAGVDFYSYALNRPIRLSDPKGLSPQDVQRIRQICHACVQNMVNDGVRRQGSGSSSPLRAGFDGQLNDQTSNQSIIGRLTGSRRLGCKDQAWRAKDCLDNGNAIQPFDAHWTFTPVKWWLGFHTVVRAQSSDPNDPTVYCDPWRDFAWTALPSGAAATP